MDYEILTKKIVEADLGYTFEPSSNYSDLKTLGLPNEIIDFYKKFNPTRYRDGGPARLCGIDKIISENSEYVPGCDTSPQGIIVIATTFCGDGICINLNNKDQPDIYLISHENDYENMEAEEILTMYPNKKVCASLSQFLYIYSTNDKQKLDLNL